MNEDKKDVFLNVSAFSDLSDEDTSTLKDDHNMAFDGASSVVYIPEEGRFSGDANTLVESQEGSSSKPLGNNWGRFGLNTSIQQLQYNENRIALDRSIKQSQELLIQLSRENNERPVFYPSNFEDDSMRMLNSKKAHIALVKNKETSSRSWKKSKIDVEDDNSIAEFKILKINFHIDASKREDRNLTEQLDKKSIANLFDQKLKHQVRYLANLKSRIDDTTSKVFVTGDLNAGKSTFCNALLRRKVLPEDQQPCTSVFCEVIDASKENNGVEEVHAISIGKRYNIRDESSYEIHSLSSLKDLVYECDNYELLKVYVKDHRSLEESLLRNGVIDIKLIDAPGLNMDSYSTTQVFSRQEEIDLVVFVVNSENHFTLSAKEFIAAAAAEKRYVFIVVNRFDNIVDEEKCKKRILEQVKNLSPDTHKNAGDFVHFVSSTVAFNDPGDDGDPNDDEHRDDPFDNNDPNFEHLEASLRKFILERRALSKLLPVKSYLVNLLQDLSTLSSINEKIYLEEKNLKEGELRGHVAPKHSDLLIRSSKVAEKINNIIEKTYSEVYDITKTGLLDTLRDLEGSQMIRYPGLQDLYDYAKKTQSAIMETISSNVEWCQEEARRITGQRIDEINKVGEDGLGPEFTVSDKIFKSEVMFSKRRDTLQRRMEIPIELGDFFDPNWNSCLMWLGVPQEFIKGARKQIEFYNPVEFLTSFPSDAYSVKHSLSSKLTVHTLYSSGKLLTTGIALRKLYNASYIVTPSMLKNIALPLLIGVSGFTLYYLINDMPSAFPRKQVRKIKKQFLEMDYPHMNADRVARECRHVLSYPSRHVMNRFQTAVDKIHSDKEKLEKDLKDAETSYGYFHDFLSKIQYQKKLLDEIDLEAVSTVD